jgi:hypothetical protein
MAAAGIGNGNFAPHHFFESSITSRTNRQARCRPRRKVYAPPPTTKAISIYSNLPKFLLKKKLPKSEGDLRSRVFFLPLGTARYTAVTAVTAGVR